MRRRRVPPWLSLREVTTTESGAFVREVLSAEGGAPVFDNCGVVAVREFVFIQVESSEVRKIDLEGNLRGVRVGPWAVLLPT